ncbi:RNA polymerase sigma factor [Streptomyces sp. NPDC008141]|uniref:RNA polymerase sigma factor n=1 Tax=Streptomyces sp. NPDC008141 TaxID=3364815 RepID=UPI0036EE045E
MVKRNDGPDPFADPEEGKGRDDFDDFVRAEHRRLVLFVVTLGATWEEAEDAVAEVLLEVLQRWSQIHSPRAYCRLAAERAYVNSEVRLRKAPAAAVRSTWAVATHRPTEAVFEAVEHEYALRHLRLLNQEQRRVMAFLYDGWTAEEIAELLGKKASTVRSNIRHARKRLKKAIAEEQAAEVGPHVARLGMKNSLGGQ